MESSHQPIICMYAVVDIIFVQYQGIFFLLNQVSLLAFTPEQQDAATSSTAVSGLLETYLQIFICKFEWMLGRKLSVTARDLIQPMKGYKLQARAKKKLRR